MDKIKNLLLYIGFHKNKHCYEGYINGNFYSIYYDTRGCYMDNNGVSGDECVVGTDFNYIDLHDTNTDEIYKAIYKYFQTIIRKKKLKLLLC